MLHQKTKNYSRDQKSDFSRGVCRTWFGHSHEYSRTCEVFQGQCLGKAADGSANGPVHVLIGHAGQTLYWQGNIPGGPPHHPITSLPSFDCAMTGIFCISAFAASGSI